MRDRRWLPIIAVLAFLAFVALESLFGDFWLIGKEFFDLLPPPFNHIAFFGTAAIGGLILPLGCMLLLTYHRFSTRNAAIRRNEAAKQNSIGTELFGKKEYESSVRAFTAAVRTDSSMAAAFINRGCAYYHLNKLDEALDDLDEAIRLTPRSAMAYGWRGYAFCKLKEWDQAIADFDKALKLDPKLSALLLMRARSWLAKGEGARALADFDRAVACAPDDEESHRCRAEFWMMKSDFDRAIADFTQAIRINPASSEDFRDRGLCYHLKAEHQKGIADADEALRLNPSDGLAFNNRGVCRLKLGKYAAALADLQQALRLEPKHPNPYKNLAWLGATCPDSSFRNGAQAVEWAKNAFELAKEEPTAWLPIMAAAHAEAGDFAQAIEWETRFRDSGSPQSRTEAEARLELYRAGKPYREEPLRR